MDYIYAAAEKHGPGAILDAGPYRLNDIRDAGADETGAYTYLVEPLTPLMTSLTAEDSHNEVQRLRIKALLSDPEVQLFEVQLPSLDFDLNPGLDSFLNGNPSPRIVHDFGRDFLVVCVGEMHEMPIYAVTKVTFKRKNDIVSGLLTLREAIRFSSNPVFLTQEFSSYSLRQHADFGPLFLPPKGLRHNGLTRKQRARKNVRIKRKLENWKFV
ncbi:hypothetical protein [Rhizobium sp. MHM7A]|uniref:hypothetical protein n=1 Tax=Rhizobium sp. MHM7A TaxID=2583233 RepID=UPI0011063365|nr:hypothetical protein [Rhizobium sp. MHM7A]TLX16329.1 hypothetical protein FFR93_03085 [Rhizobium sp. MHM7A]